MSDKRANNETPASADAVLVRRGWSKPKLSITDVKQLTQGQAGSTSDGGGNNRQPNQPSDRRLKRDIVPVGRTMDGIPVYRFRYLWSSTELVGVMAQEVLEVIPSAVSVGPEGFYQVDYAQIGFACMPYEDFVNTPAAAFVGSASEARLSA